MKIEKVKTWLVEGVKYNWTLVKLYTDAGVTGIGPGILNPRPGFYI